MPSTDEILIQATAALNDGDVETAEGLCTQVLNQVQHPQALLVLANVRERQDRMAEGLELLEKAQQIGGEHPNTYLHRMRMVLRLLKNDPLAVPDGLSRAQEFILRAIELAPNDNILRREYAELLDRMGRTEEAIEIVRPLLDHPPVPVGVLTTYSRLVVGI